VRIKRFPDGRMTVNGHWIKEEELIQLMHDIDSGKQILVARDDLHWLISMAGRDLCFQADVDRIHKLGWLFTVPALDITPTP